MSGSQSMMRARGLHTFSNYLSSIPEGSLLKAENTVIDREGVIEPRRGFRQYGTIPDFAKQILIYKDRVLAYYSNKLAYDSDSGVFVDFDGTYNEASNNIRMQGTELRGNFYFTTESGIKKISANTRDLSEAFIGDAGAPNARDIIGSLVYESGGFLTAFSQVAYRIIWNRIDNNENLLQGRPSSRLVITNVANTTANVNITVTTPSDVIPGDFFQIYRTATDSVNTSGEISDLAAGDEMRLVYESPGIDSTPPATFTVKDIVPETLRDSNANLYTNEITGEGILQSNDIPPFATDVDQYQSSLFLANTRTRHTLNITLAGVNELVNSGLNITSISAGATPTVTTGVDHNLVTGDYVYLSSTGDIEGEYQVTVTGNDTFTVNDTAVGSSTGVVFTNSFLITRNTDVNRYFFVGRQASHTLTCVAGGSVVNDSSFNINTFDDSVEYAIVYRVDAAAITEVADKINIVVDVDSGDSSDDIALKTKDAMEAFTTDFVILQNSNILTITLSNAGTTSITADQSATGNTLALAEQGIGEDPVNGLIRISFFLLPEQQTDDTARSLVRAVNQASFSNIVSARYTTTAFNTPGQFSLESLVLDLESFSVALYDPKTKLNDADEGNFNDNFDPTLPTVIVASAVDNGTTSTITSNSHGLVNDQTVKVPGVDGFLVVSNVTINTFDVQGSYSGQFIYYKTDVISSNESVGNRLYFSKFQQPDAVPALNFIDIGRKDKDILKIKALRDSLFVFKEDGIYRVSGVIAPDFQVQQIDTSILIAPDSVAVLNNQIYALCSQGVIAVTENGVSIVSRNIEDIFTNISTDNFPNFSTATFGVGYEKDRAYILWTVSQTDDTTATKAYRYNTFTQTWTEWTTKANCVGVVDFINDAGTYTNKLYIGATDTAIIEEERKGLNRLDFADREFSLSIPGEAIKSEDTLNISSVQNVLPGDVLVQTQYLTPYQVRRLSLQLALDPGIPSASVSFYQTYEIVKGDNLAEKLSELVVQINSDLGTAYSTSFSADFATIQSEFNTLITDLNSNTTLVFADYKSSTGTKAVEMIVTSIDINTNDVTGNIPLFLEGPIISFQGIKTDVIYAPMMFGDPSLMKQVREFTMMFESDNNQTATLSFNTDLSPGFEPVNFELEGTGVWGLDNYDTTTWGGEGTASPFRTYIPRQKQRCRFIRARYEHSAAFNKYRILGISYVFRGVSTRAYR